MNSKEASIQPKYSIGISGLARPAVDATFAFPSTVSSVDGAEWNAPSGSLVVGVGQHAHGKIVTIASVLSRDAVTLTQQEGSTATIVLETDTEQALVRDVTLKLEKDARATVVIVPRGTGKTYLSLSAELQERAELTLLQVFTDGAELKYEERIELVGSDAGVHVVTLAMPRGESLFDLSTEVNHKADATRGHVRALGFLSGTSKTVYRAMGDILPHVVAPESSEEARFIIMDKGAEISAIPSLDIASDHVATSHKLAVYRVGEKELFYPELRGLSEEEGRELILGGLLDAELACIKNDDIVQRMKAQIMRTS